MTDSTQERPTAVRPDAAAPGSAVSRGKDVGDLFAEYYQTRDPGLRDRLVVLHISLVRYLAGKFANRGEPVEDLIQVGTIGLINAVDRFDPLRGNRFSTYAAPTIVGEIKRHFRDKAWNLKVPRRLQELNLATARAAEALTQTLGRSPTIAEIARHLNASEEETVEAIELGNAYETISLDSRMENQGESTALTLAEFIGGEDEALLDVEAFDDLREAIRNLDEREQNIIALRFFSDLSQTEVAHHLRISQMHVSRLQQRALRKLKTLLAK
ncbi:MAG TPA: SigB/SigF/SigG family RNA polymerase sigma factor [Armatimonadota bacterium]|jgi:RNA polymerase sigma-B factor